jgi:3-deoxy-D-manno-octulosonic acid kinase
MITQYRVWGEIPPGFKKIKDSGGRRLILRSDQEGALSARSWDESTPDDRLGGLQGRERLRSLNLGNGDRVLLRRYRHGGFFRGITRGIFFTWPPRPFRELVITEELRRRGVPTVEVYGACVEPVWGPFYRGWLATRALSGAQDLWTALQSGFVREVGEERSLRAVAKSLRALHGQGVYHADLNLKNILLRVENGGVGGYIIDFDKAKLLLGGLPPQFAEKNLARLLRSVRKLDPERRYFSAARWNDFLSYYHQVDGAEN